MKARRVFVTLRAMKLGDDLRDARWIYLKGFLFLLIGLAAGALILLEMPTLRVAALLSLCVWAWCRFYYFLFYVIEKYVDGRFRFAGVGSFVLYWLRRKAE